MGKEINRKDDVISNGTGLLFVATTPWLGHTILIANFIDAFYVNCSQLCQ